MCYPLDSYEGEASSAARVYTSAKRIASYPLTFHTFHHFLHLHEPRLLWKSGSAAVWLPLLSRERHGRVAQERICELRDATRS